MSTYNKDLVEIYFRDISYISAYIDLIELYLLDYIVKFFKAIFSKLKPSIYI